MSTLGRTRLRLAADTATFDAPLDVLRRATPQFWRGNDVQFELAVFFNGALQDVSNLASLTLEIRPLGANGGPPDPSFTPLMGATISSFDNTTTLDDWNAGTKQQAVVAFTAAQSNIAAGAAWLSIFVITSDSPGRVITLCAGPVRVLEDGAGLATTPTPAADTFYTAAESDARFAPLSGGGGVENANLILAGPTSGSAAVPTFRSLVTADIPSIAQSQVTGLSSALNALAPLASPGLTGTPTAPTVATATDSSTKLATTAFVQAAIAAAGGGGGGTWGSITGTLSSQTDLQSALNLKAPLASPALTGTPTAPTVSGTSDSSTKIATTAFVQAAVAAVSSGMSNPMTTLGDIIYGGSSGTPTRLAGNTTTTQKILAQTGTGSASATPAWVAFPFTIDGSSNIIFNGSTALVTQDGSGTHNVFLSVYGSFAAKSTDGLHKLIIQDGTNLDVLIIQHNGTSGQSAIDFMSSHDVTESGGLFKDAIYGAIGYDYTSSGYSGNQRIYLSCSPAFTQASGFAEPTSGVGQLALIQEGYLNSGYRDCIAWGFNSDWTIISQDPYKHTKYQSGQVSSGYYENNWSQTDDSNHYWSSSPQGLTLRQTTHESKELLVSIRSSNFSVSGLEAFGPSRGMIGTNSTDGLSLAAADSSGGYIRLFTGGYAAAKERMRIDPSGNVMIGTTSQYGSSILSVNGNVAVAGGGTAILRAQATVTSGAASSTGTLTNAPTAGNPTKWIPFDDAGTIRYIPAW